MKVGWYRKRWLVILIHAVAWVLLFSLPTLLKPSFTNVHAAPPSKNSYFYHYSVNFLTWTCLFYINAYILIPRFINAKKYQYYFLSLLGIISICLLINWLSFRLLLPEFNYNIKGFAVFYLFPSIFFLATSTVYKMLLDRNEFEKKTKERETENLKTELSFLRSQVSPHFMFNVLNNMVALARKKSDLLEPSLIKLSSLLRYMLYETDEEKVSLDKEIDYLQSYIDLQQQRFGKNVQVNVCLK